MLLQCYHYCHSKIIIVWQTYFVNGMAVLLLLGVYTELNVIVILFIIRPILLMLLLYCLLLGLYCNVIAMLLLLS